MRYNFYPNYPHPKHFLQDEGLVLINLTVYIYKTMYTNYNYKVKYILYIVTIYILTIIYMY